MAKKKKNKHDIWKRLNFKYRLSVMNENTLEEVWKIKASIFSGAVLLAVFAGILVFVTAVFIIATPVRYYLPGYLDAEVRDNAVRAAIRIDSLEQQLNYQEAYIGNLKDIFTGKVSFDSVKVLDTISVSENDPSLMKSQLEKDYVERYREEEKYNLSVLPSNTVSPAEGVVFFKPLKGLIVNKFSPGTKQFGMSLRIAGKETVSAVMEGSVIFAGYDINTGYTMQIQHNSGFVSVYRNNSMLLKETGDNVRKGEAIAVVDRSGDDANTQPDFVFELWYKGHPVNPEDYISF